MPELRMHKTNAYRQGRRPSRQLGGHHVVRNDHYHRIVIHSIPLQSIDETGKGFLENSHAAEIHHFPTAGFGLHTIHMPVRFRIII